MSKKEVPSAAPFTDDELKEFLGSRRVVIGDPTRASGRSLRKFLMQLGAKSEDVILCETAGDAFDAVAEKATHVLFTDVTFGFDVIKLQQSAFKSGTEFATIVLTPDPSSSEMGRIAEKDVDAILLKPLHYQGFLECLWAAFAEKIKPSPYMIQIEKGKGCIKAGALEEAEIIFDSSRSLDPTPTLAFYYLGVIQETRGDLANAIFLFEQGLELNEKDYRCLTGLFDVRMKAEQFTEAYEIAKRIHVDFPVSPDRILDLVKLSVQMRRFEDVIDYCRIFQSLEGREEALGRVVVAGMLVCSKYLALKQERERSREVMKNASKIALESGVLAVDVLRYFVETEHFEDGREYYAKMPRAVQDSAEALEYYIEILHAGGNSVELLEIGGMLKRMSLPSPRLYTLLIDHSRKLKHSENTINALILEARKLFPDEFAEMASSA